MLKVQSRKDLALVTGKRPEKVPELAPPAPAAPDLTALAAQLAKSNELMAAAIEAQRAPKAMKATIHRDSKGRMSHVDVTIV